MFANGKGEGGGDGKIRLLGGGGGGGADTGDNDGAVSGNIVCILPFDKVGAGISSVEAEESKVVPVTSAER